MLKHIIQKCVIIALTIGYVIGILFLQNAQGEVFVDMLTTLVFGLWMYILLDDFDVKVLSERRVLRPKHIAYESLFFASLAMITASFVLDSFGWALATLIGSIVCFIAGCVLYYHFFKLEDEFVSTEIENCQHMLWVLKHLRNKAEDWTEDRIMEYATKEFRMYPKNMHLERGLDVCHPVDSTGALRTLAQMREEDPSSPEVQVAESNIRKMVAGYFERKALREQKKLQKKQKKAKEAK